MRFLLHTYRFPLIKAETSQVSIVRPVKKLSSLIRTHPAEKVPLIVSIKMDLECLARSFIALQQLLFQVRFAGCPDQGRRPILSRENIIDLRPRRYRARPAYESRNAVAALPICILFTSERCGT